MSPPTLGQLQQTVQMLEADGASLPSIFSKAKTETDVMTILLALDVSLKASPQLLPAVRAFVSSTSFPSCCQPLLNHWADVRFLPRTHAPSPCYGYFFWKKTFRQAQVETTARKKSEDSDQSQRRIPVVGDRQICCKCHDFLDVRFCNDLNQWTYFGAWQLVDGSLLHKQCVDLSQLANMLTRK
jgi:hypothetical protein